MYQEISLGAKCIWIPLNAGTILQLLILRHFSKKEIETTCNKSSTSGQGQWSHHKWLQIKLTDFMLQNHGCTSPRCLQLHWLLHHSSGLCASSNFD